MHKRHDNCLPCFVVQFDDNQQILRLLYFVILELKKMWDDHPFVSESAVYLNDNESKQNVKHEQNK